MARDVIILDDVAERGAEMIGPLWPVRMVHLVAAVGRPEPTETEEAQKQIDAANAKVREVEGQRDAAIEARVREVREAMEKDKADALAKRTRRMTRRHASCWRKCKRWSAS
jgi:hypothetical protein